MVLRRQLAQRRAARRVDEGEMGVALDQARHQESAAGIEPLGALGGSHGLAGGCHRLDALALDQDLARKRRRAAAVPDRRMLDQQSHADLPLVSCRQL